MPTIKLEDEPETPEETAAVGREALRRGEVVSHKGILWTLAVVLGRQDGIEDVETVLAEQGLAVVRATLAPGHVGWDEGAINAGVAELRHVPPEYHEAYYRAYAESARERAEELVRALAEE